MVSSRGKDTEGRGRDIEGEGTVQRSGLDWKVKKVNYWLKECRERKETKKFFDKERNKSKERWKKI